MLRHITIRKIIVTFLILTFSFSGLYVWMTYSLYKFSVAGSGEYQLFKNTNSEKTEITTIFGISFIPKNTNSIDISNDSKLTRHTLLKKPWFGIKNEDINLQDQNEVDKIGVGGVGCDIRLNTEAESYSYNCFNHKAPVLKFADKINLERTNSIAYSGYLYTLVRAPYLDGLLTIDLESDINQTVTIRNLSPTGEILQSKELDAYHQYRIFSNSSNKMFMIYDTNEKKMLIFKNGLDGEYEEKPISELIGTDTGFAISSCSVSNDRFACFATLSSSSHQDGEDEVDNTNHEDAPSEGILFTQSTSSSSYRKLPYAFTTICLDDNTITAQQGKNIYNLDITNPREVSLLDSGVRSLNCSGSTVAYSKQHDIFEVKGFSSYLLFSLDRFSMSNVTTQGDGTILFDTYIASSDTQVSDNKLHTYAINSDQPIKDVSTRLENILPYSTVNLPLYDIDYDSQSIYVSPQLSVISDHQTGQTIVDEDALNKTKAIIEDKLKKDGILDRLKLVYY